MAVVPSVVDSSEAQFLNFVQDFAKVLKYWNAQGNTEGNWQPFFRSDVSFVLADIGRYQVAPVRKAMRALKKRFLATTRYPEQEQLLVEFYELLLTEAQTLGQWYDRLSTANNADSGLNDFFIERTRSNLHGGFQSFLSSYDVLCSSLDTLPNKLAGKDISQITQNVIILFQPLVNPQAQEISSPGNGQAANIESFWIYYEQLLHSLLTTITQVLTATPKFLQDTLSTPNHSPQVALLLGFYQLMGPAREQLNQLSARQLDFYLNKVLQQAPLSHTPDSTFLSFQIAKGTSPFIPAGTSFLAGTSSAGAPILYNTEKDLSLNQVQPKAFQTVYNGTKNNSLRQAVRGTVTANPMANSADGLGAKITQKPASWPTFGLTSQQAPNNVVDNPAQLGFAIASPDLYLSDGQRRVRCSVFTKDEDISALATAIKSLQLPKLKAPALSSTQQAQLNTWKDKYQQAMELRQELLEQIDPKANPAAAPKPPSSDNPDPQPAAPFNPNLNPFVEAPAPAPEKKPKHGFLSKLGSLFHHHHKPQPKPAKQPSSKENAQKKEAHAKALKFSQLEQEFDTLETTFNAAYQECVRTISSISGRDPLPLDDWLDACIECVIFQIKYHLLNNHHAANVTHHVHPKHDILHSSFIKDLQKTLGKALSPKADALGKLKSLADMTGHAELANKLTGVSDSLNQIAEETTGESLSKDLASASKITDYFKKLGKKQTPKKAQASINEEIKQELQKLGDESHTEQVKDLELQLMEALDRTKAVTHSIFSQQWLVQMRRQIQELETKLIDASTHALAVTPSTFTQQKWQLLSEMVPFLQQLQQEHPASAKAPGSDAAGKPAAAPKEEKPKGLFGKLEADVTHVGDSAIAKKAESEIHELTDSSLAQSVEKKAEGVVESKLGGAVSAGVHELEHLIPKHSKALDDTINTLALAHKGWSHVNELFGDLKSDVSKPLLKHLESHVTPQNLNKQCSTILGMTNKVLGVVEPFASKSQQQKIGSLNDKIDGLQQRISTIDQSHVLQTKQLSSLIDASADKLKNQQDRIEQALKNASLLKALGQQALGDLPGLGKMQHHQPSPDAATPTSSDGGAGTAAPPAPSEPMVTALLDLNKRLRYWAKDGEVTTPTDANTKTGDNSAATAQTNNADASVASTATTSAADHPSPPPPPPQAPPIFPTEIDWSTLNTILQSAFQVEYSSAKGWKTPSTCQIGWTYQLPEKSASDLSPTKSGLLYDLSLDALAAAPAAWSQKSCGGNLGTTDPALKFTIQQSMHLSEATKDTLALNPYPLLAPLELTEIELLGDTVGTRNFTAQNQISALNPKKPFAPFGEQAIQEAEFYLGNNEAFSKKLDYLSQEIEWYNIPKAAVGFAEPYDLYNRFGPSGTCYTNASFKWSLDILNQGTWSPLSSVPVQITDKDSESAMSKANTSDMFEWLQLPFTNSTLYQSHTNFEPKRPSLVKPPASMKFNAAAFSSWQYLPMPQLPGLPQMSPLDVGPLLPSTLLIIDPKGLGQTTNTEAPSSFSSKTTWSDASQSGFLRFTLQQPEYAFGSSLYPEVLAAINGANMTRMVDLVAFRALKPDNQKALIEIWQYELEQQAAQWKKEDAADKKAESDKAKKDKPKPPPPPKGPSLLHSIAKGLEHGLVGAAIDGIGIAEKATALSPEGALVKILGDFAGKELHHLTEDPPPSSHPGTPHQPNAPKPPAIDTNKVFKPLKPPPLPWVPKVKSIVSNYGSHEALKVATPSDSNITFYQLQPFGCSAPLASTNSNVETTPLLARFDDQAYLFIGLENVEAPQTITLLFELDEATGNRKLPAASPELASLTSNGWETLPQTQWQDGTAGLIKSGVLSATLLSKPASSTSLFENTPSLTWLRLSVAEYASAACQTLNVLSQATAVVYSSGADLDTHFNAPLPAGTISKPAAPIPGVTKTVQPLASSGGVPAETQPQFHARVAERLRHKDRGITRWDFEHLALQQFPKLRAALCLNNTKPAATGSSTHPGATTVVIFPEISAQQAPLFPLAEHASIIETKAFLAARCDSFLDLTVCNPEYQFLMVEAALSFTPGYDPSHYLKLLNQMLVDAIAPWSQSGSTINPFETNTTRDTLLQKIQAQDYIQSVQSISLSIASSAAGDDAQPLEVQGSEAILPANTWGLISSVEQHQLSIATGPSKPLTKTSSSTSSKTVSTPSPATTAPPAGNTIFIGASS